MLRRSARETYRLTSLSSLLRDLSNPLEIPQFQRLVDTERVREIVTGIQVELDREREPLLPNCLIIAETPKRRYLIDGQHRLAAYAELHRSVGFETQVMCNVITVADDQEAQRLFQLVNQTVAVADLPPGVSLDQVNPVVKHFYDRYPKIFSSARTGTCRRPHLHRTRFEEEIGKIVEKTSLSATEIIDKIETYNSELHQLYWSAFRRKNETCEQIQRLREQATKKGGFLLGLFPDYEWVPKLFGLSQQKIVRWKEKIPMALRLAVWNRYQGKNVRRGECPLCQSEISLEDFDCAHDQAEIAGGELSIDNLYPVCHGCNLRTGTRSYDEMRRILRGEK